MNKFQSIMQSLVELTLALASVVTGTINALIVLFYWRVIVKISGDPDLVLRTCITLAVTSALTAYLLRKVSAQHLLTKIALTASFASAGLFVIWLHVSQLSALTALIRSTKPIF